MAVQLKKYIPLLGLLLPLAFIVIPFEAHASVISIPSNNLGLAGYWNFNEGSGSTAHDYSGNGVGGTLTGSPSWITGVFGDALQFTSSGQYVTTGYTIPAQSSATSFTWSAWVYQTSTGGTQVILGFRNGATWLKLTPSALEYGSGSIISNTIPAGKWVQITIVKNGSSFTYYQNGAVIGTATNSGSAVSHTFFIGSDPGFSDGTPHYYIDDVRVYSRALSATEVADLYDTQRALMNASYSPGTLASGLVGWWTMDGKDTVWTSSTAATEADESSGGDTLMLNNFNRTTAAVIGKLGQALTLNDSNQSLSHSNISAFNFGTGDFSVSFWMKPRVPWGTGTTLGVIGQKTGDTYYGWQIYQDSGHGGHLDMRIALQNNFLTSATVPAGQWTLATFVRKGGNTYWYLNGVLDNSGTNSASISDTGPFYIGYAPTWTAYYPGALDDVRVYNRALSASEVEQLYNLGASTHFNASSASTTDGSSLASGLIGLWTFDGKDMLQNVKDESGQGNDGYLEGFTSTTSAEVIGKLGQALNFNGSSSYVFGPSPSGPAGAVTIAAWVKLSAYTPWASILDRYGSETLDCLSLGLDSSAGTNLMFMWNNPAPFNNRVTGNSSIPLNKWTYVAASSDGSTVTFYVNGVSDGTASVGAPCTSGNLILGVNFPGGDEYLDGALDDVRLYDRALSASEMEQLYNLGK